MPKTLQSSGTNTFGRDYCYLSYYSWRALTGGGDCSVGSYAGVWFRDGSSYWSYDNLYCGFRAAGYAS